MVMMTMMRKTMRTAMKILVMLMAVLMCVVMTGVQGSHFRGGTISWKSEGGYKVHFYYRLGWTYGQGPGCVPSKIGQLVTGFSTTYWTCQSSNCNASNIHNVNYYCTGADRAQNWEQGKNDFTFTFPGTGPFTIGYRSNAWITLANGKGGGNWNIATTVDLRTRSDTAAPNSSPQSQSRPMYFVPFNCEVRLRLPVIDPDDDVVRCRWATGNECMSVCNALPYAVLDEETCTLVFNSTAVNNYKPGGTYAVAVTIEDFPKIPMTMTGTGTTSNNSTKTPNDAISAVPLQFLVQAIKQPGPCDAGPRFVSPTPKEGEVIVVEEGDKVEVDLYADNGNDTSAKANQISTSGPVTLTQSAVVPDKNRTDTYTTKATWQTAHKDIGSHIVCGSVANDKGRTGEQRCFTIRVVPKGCRSSPCQNSGQCVANLGKYTCICRPGFTGRNCEVNVDDCFPNACPVGDFCHDGINSFSCSNTSSQTATTTSATIPNAPTMEVNQTGMCPLVYDNCDCWMRPNTHDVKGWLDLSRKARDVFCFLYGLPIGLIFSVLTFFCIFRPCERHCRHETVVQRQRRRKTSTKMPEKKSSR